MSTLSGSAPAVRRRARNALVRHGIVAVLAAGLVIGFATVHAQWSQMHRWNRAFADAALVLIALCMAIGPVTRFVRSATQFLPCRREMGIHSCFLALVHAAIGWVEWDLMRLFGFEWHPDLMSYVMIQPWFAALVLLDFALRSAVYVRTVSGRGKSLPEGAGGRRAPV